MTTTTPGGGERLTIPPTRRERLRTATVAELKETARRLLRTGGPAAVSLRAIARDVGMTAPAIYRYFESLDALVQDLVADLFAEMRDAVEATRQAHRGADPIESLTEMARAFRGWALRHPGEFALMFGSPVPGVTQFDKPDVDLRDASAEFGEPFLAVLTELYATRPPPPEPPQPLAERLRAAVEPYLHVHGDRFPLSVVYGFLAGWTRLYGLVAMEVFGHLRWALSDVEPLFEMEIRRTIAEMTGGR